MTSTEQVAPDEPLGIADVLRAGIGLAVALVVAIYAAIGIQGDLLTRAVRNTPWVISIAFILVIVGVALPFFQLRKKASERRRRVFEVVGLSLVVLGSISAIVAGGYALAERELPDLTMTPEWPEVPAAATTVTVTATATSLRSNEDVMLRVIGITPGSPQELRDSCVNAGGPWVDPTVGGDGQIIFWGTSGPSPTGAAKVSTVVLNPSEYVYLCAYAALRDRSTKSISDDRWVWNSIRIDDISAVPATPTPVPAPAPAPVG